MRHLNSSPLHVNFAGLSLANPTMLASGILGLSAESIGLLVEKGAGAIVTKSIGIKPRKGYPNPTVVQVGDSIVNAIGLPNPGITGFIDELRMMKRFGVPVIVSVYGFSVEEYIEVAEIAVEAGADAVELNVSCPHVKQTGLEIGQKLEVLADVVHGVKAAVKKPVFAKLSPNVTDIAEYAEAVADAGADAVTATNTVRAMAIDVEAGIPILSNRIGGLSGPSVKPIAVRCVYEIYERVELPIIGCGGIVNWCDAVEFILAGASAIQIGTAVSTKGPDIFSSIAHGVDNYLKSKGFRNIGEIVGLSHRK